MGLRNNTNVMDEIFPKNQEGIYVLKDPFERIIETKKVKNAGINVEGIVRDQQYTAPKDVTAGVIQPTEPLASTPIAQQTLGTGPAIGGSDKPVIQEKLPKTVSDTIEQEGIRNRQLVALQAGAQFFSDVFNANSAYNATTGEARLNIMQARNQAADALYRGRQARMEAESEGRQAGESALLAMAVQGQDVSGAAVQKIQSSYEATGVFNGMREEINSIREALGYQLEEVAYKYQMRNAGIARQTAIIGSMINLGASSMGTFSNSKGTL
jgi:hypothetical protein